MAACFGAAAGYGGGSEAAGQPPAEPPTGRLVVRASSPREVPLYIEGAVPFVRVSDAGGGVVLERRLEWDRPLNARLPAGRYRLLAYQRPCSGYCGELDPPRDHCTRRLRLRAGEPIGAAETVVVRLLFRTARPCRPTVRSDWPPRPVLRSHGRALRAAQGPYCPAGPPCPLPDYLPLTRRALPVHAGARVSVDTRRPVRRLQVQMCGRVRPRPRPGRRRWVFRVPAATVAEIRACGQVGIEVVYAGRAPLRGVRAVFGARLRRHRH